MTSEALENGVVVDRSRLSHRDSKNAILLQARLEAVSKSGDTEALAALMDEVDLHMEKIIVSVPDDFYVSNIKADEKCPASGWMDHLRQDKYEELVQLLRKPPVGAEGN